MPMLKILLVDDDPNIRQLVNLYLQKEGFVQIQVDQLTDVGIIVHQ